MKAVELTEIKRNMRSIVFNIWLSNLGHNAKTVESETNGKKYANCLTVKNRMVNFTIRKKAGIAEVAYAIKRLKWKWAHNETKYKEME